MTRRKIAVVTSSRADYGHLYWPLRELAARPSVEPRLIAIGPHLSPEFGHTVEEIERDGFAVDERVECLLSSDTDVGMAKTIGVATLGVADVLARLRPDILLLIADRYEMLAPAAAALVLRIPVAHIEGGEVTEGAIDDAVRNALTKLSHLHLTTTESAKRRVLAMGEEAWRVHRVGSPSLDNLRRRELIPRDALGAQLGLDLSRPTVVVTYHPVTVERETTAEAGPLFSALERLPQQIVFCYPNADAGSRAIVERVREFCRVRTDARLFVNLPHLTYWSLLACAELFVGNSSSGIMETPSLRLPAVNVGIRQAGRERARNVLDAEPTADSIIAQARRALDPVFRASLEGMTNPYGDGHAAERIAELLTEVPLGEKLFVKRAVPLEGLTWRHDAEAGGA
ncbi:MAG TPA: UDP-N-acetylglucosamine 2-epimerase [Pyrinomonadaceae bacterium]|nr:UDP-N-acetylglucosamine 2-epimerase [Pyrinomonadaceae bacterium]